jgi:hypothetical protein
MSWNKALSRLQEVDLELDAARTQLKELEVALADDEALREAREAAQRAEVTTETKGKEQRDLEFELNRVETHRKQVEVRLYGGGIKNPREMTDMQSQLQSLKRRKEELEDELLEAMIAREEAKAGFDEAKARLAKVDARYEKGQGRLKEERADLRARVGELEGEAEELRGKIPPAIVSSYEHIRVRMGGMAVSHLHQGICNVCGMEVNTQRKRMARAGEETYCDGCGRLLLA